MHSENVKFYLTFSCAPVPLSSVNQTVQKGRGEVGVAKDLGPVPKLRLLVMVSDP